MHSYYDEAKRPYLSPFRPPALSCGSGAYTWDRVDMGPELTCRPVQLNPQIILAHTHPPGRLSCAAAAATCAAASTCPATSCTACSAATSLRLRSTAACDARHLPAMPATFLRRHRWGARHLLDPRRGLLPCARPERSKVGGCWSYLN